MPAIATHPSRYLGPPPDEAAKPEGGIVIPREGDATLSVGGRELAVTNLNKMFWSEDHPTKSDLLQYYANVSPYLLPHLKSRPMVMKRYPNGASGEFFFQKHAPDSKPAWIPVCEVLHPSANLVDFPVINEVASLLWAVNLGCIDMNPWYATCDDVDRPDYMHFDLDPTPGAEFPLVRQAALLLRDALAAQKIKSYPKTSGSRGIHIYVPIVRGPTQKEVWTFAKALAMLLAKAHPTILTSEYRIAKREPQRVLVDYNQNAWGRTLASVYSVRPKPGAPVSAPVTWEEIEAGLAIETYRLDNMLKRLEQVGDLFKPLLEQKGRFRLAAS